MAATGHVKNRDSRRNATRAGASRVTRGLGSIVACLVLAAASLGAARAEDETDEDVRRRMDDRYFFVRSLDRGWEPFLADIRQQIAALGDAGRPPVLAIRDVAAADYAGRVESIVPKGEARAFELYVMLSADAVNPARRPDFALKAATIEVRQAKRIEDNDEPGALKLALSAAERSPGYADAYEMIARLGLKEATREESKDAFFAALDVLERSSKLLPEGTPARAPLVAARTRILETTGELAVDWLGTADAMARVKGPKTDFMTGTIEFRAVDGTKAPPPQDPTRPMRVRNGRFEVTQRGNGPSTFTAGQVAVTSQGAVVTLLAALPDNMVLVPAVAGQDAFLIDRTEVTVSAFADPNAGASGSNRAAKGGLTFQQARDWAERAGKKLPSRAQWLTAAFGNPAGTGRRYPWGDAAPVVGMHFVGNQDAPKPVGTCPAGASPFGCLDMAGNVWEWLAEERFIGGGFRATELTADMETDGNDPPWTADFLRDSAPSAELYDDDARMTPKERSRYFNYRLKKDDSRESTLEQLGLRCIVNLGKPWRQRP